MSTENLSLVLHKANDLRLEQTPLPEKAGNNGNYYRFLLIFLKSN
jgi:hypothetical protein